MVDIRLRADGRLVFSGRGTRSSGASGECMPRRCAGSNAEGASHRPRPIPEPRGSSRRRIALRTGAISYPGAIGVVCRDSPPCGSSRAETAKRIPLVPLRQITAAAMFPCRLGRDRSEPSQRLRLTQTSVEVTDFRVIAYPTLTGMSSVMG